MSWQDWLALLWAVGVVAGFLRSLVAGLSG
jgi:hypothetical protein